MLDPKGTEQTEKQFMILSSAGKPVYTRYGSETDIINLTGLIQAVLSVCLEEENPLHYFKTNDSTFVFLTVGPLYYVCISKTGEGHQILKRQLYALHEQIIFTVTDAKLESIFDRHKNFDLRTLLGGTDVLMETLCQSFSRPEFFLACNRSIFLPVQVRKKIQQVWDYFPAPNSCLHKLLIAGKKIVYSSELDTAALLLNMVYSSSTFTAVQGWFPVCLPRYNSKVFLHCYSSFISSKVCIVFLSRDKEAFFELSKYQSILIEKLNEHKILNIVEEVLSNGPINVSQLGISGLRHFMFKLHKHEYMYETAYQPPYTKPSERQRLYICYQEGMNRLAPSFQSGSISLQIMDNDAVVVKSHTNFIIFCSFGPLVRKDAIDDALERLRSWIIANFHSFVQP